MCVYTILCFEVESSQTTRRKAENKRSHDLWARELWQSFSTEKKSEWNKIVNGRLSSKVADVQCVSSFYVCNISCVGGDIQFR